MGGYIFFFIVGGCNVLIFGFGEEPPLGGGIKTIESFFIVFLHKIFYPRGGHKIVFYNQTFSNGLISTFIST